MSRKKSTEFKLPDPPPDVIVCVEGGIVCAVFSRGDLTYDVIDLDNISTLCDGDESPSLGHCPVDGQIPSEHLQEWINEVRKHLKNRQKPRKETHANPVQPQ